MQMLMDLVENGVNLRDLDLGADRGGAGIAGAGRRSRGRRRPEATRGRRRSRSASPAAGQEEREDGGTPRVALRFAESGGADVSGRRRTFSAARREVFRVRGDSSANFEGRANL